MKTITKLLALAFIASMAFIKVDAQNACFSPMAPYTTGAAPVGNCTGDFNNDGKIDIASANQTGTVSILIGVGNGTFGAPTNFPAASGPYGVATGYFNNDLNLDLVVANIGSFNISILMGNGLGGFGAPTNYTITGNCNPREVAVGDFDGDTKTDIAVIAVVSPNVGIFLNNGNGTFGAMANYAIGSTGPTDLVVADLNADGKLDVATANSTGNSCSVLIGDGFGSFANGIPYATGTTPYGVAAADLTGDGKLDLCVSNNGSANISVLINNGNGTYAPSVPIGLGVGSMARNIKSGDFNNDGKKDMAISDPGLTKAIVLLGNGAGGFPTQNNFTTGGAPNYLSLGDFNADGKTDIVVCNQANANNGVLLNAAPTVTLSAFSNVCVNWNPITLTGGTPANGTYSGVGVNAGVFDPSVSGVGTFTINYSYNDGNGCNGNAQRTITVDLCTGIQNTSLNSNIVLYPNPCHSKFKIQSLRPITGQLLIYNVHGQVIYRAENVNEEVDLGSETKGIYFVEIHTNEGVINKKLVLQ